MAYIEINKGKKIILGSNSPRRKQLLQDAGINFEIRAFPTNENYPTKLKGSEITEYLVKKKSQEFKGVKDDEIIIDPLTTIDISSEDSEKISELSNKIEELDDVQNVYMNSNLS